MSTLDLPEHFNGMILTMRGHVGGIVTLAIKEGLGEDIWVKEGDSNIHFTSTLESMRVENHEGHYVGTLVFVGNKFITFDFPAEEGKEV